MSDQSFDELAAQPNSYVTQDWSLLDTACALQYCLEPLHHRPPPVPEPSTAVLLACGLIVKGSY